MLGKGLESLIPQNSQSGDGNANNSREPSLNPADAMQAGNAADDAGPKPVMLHMQAMDLELPPRFQHQLLREEKEEPQPAVKQSPGKKPPSGDAIFYLEVSKIHPNPHQPRKFFDEAAIKDLASSIREFGIIQPLVVSKMVKEVPTGTEVEYELIAGERRLLAAKSLGLETVPAIVRNIDFDRERLELAVIENLQRENLNPVEMARAFARLQDEFRMTQREIAVRLGKSRETVANTLRLLDLPTTIQEALEKNQISESHGRLLLAVDDPAAQEKIFRDLLTTRITTRELKHRVEMATKTEEKTHRASLPPELQMAKEKLTADLGAPVEIQQHGDTGKITISFYSAEELRQILERLDRESTSNDS